MLSEEELNYYSEGDIDCEEVLREAFEYYDDKHHDIMIGSFIEELRSECFASSDICELYNVCCSSDPEIFIDLIDYYNSDKLSLSNIRNLIDLDELFEK